MPESLLRGCNEGPESRLAEMDSGRKKRRRVYREIHRVRDARRRLMEKVAVQSKIAAGYRDRRDAGAIPQGGEIGRIKKAVRRHDSSVLSGGPHHSTEGAD